MIKLRARIRPYQLATASVTLEEEYVKSVGPLNKLVLSDLLLSPELRRSWGKGLLLVAP